MNNHFIRIGNGLDDLFHFKVDYTILYKEIKINGKMFYFSDRENIYENELEFVVRQVNIHALVHNVIEIEKDYKYQIRVNFEKNGKLGFKKVEEDFLEMIPFLNGVLH